MIVHIVDDDPGVRDALRAFFSSEGIEARSYASAASLLETDQLAPQDVIVLDVALPDASGVVLARALRARGTSSPIIAVSGLKSEAWRRAVTAIGPFASFRKPLDARALLASVYRAATLH